MLSIARSIDSWHVTVYGLTEEQAKILGSDDNFSQYEFNDSKSVTVTKINFRKNVDDCEKVLTSSLSKLKTDNQFSKIQSDEYEIDLNEKNDDRTVKVLEELQTAIDGGEEPLGEESERYNFANIVSRARESFPDEDVYYKLVTTDDYVALIITTKKKTNVYIDRYTPVEGAVGDLNTIYKLEISMVSNVIQPYDVLNNYTGILYK